MLEQVAGCAGPRRQLADGIIALLDYVISKRYDETYWAQVGVIFYRPLLSSIREGLLAIAERDAAA
jgi:hypothetical protein